MMTAKVLMKPAEVDRCQDAGEFCPLFALVVTQLALRKA